MTGHSKWRDAVVERRRRAQEPSVHRFVARYERRPWWGLGLVVQTRELMLTRSDCDEAEALRSIAAVFEGRGHWTVRRGD